MQEMPLISVIVPVYNTAPYLAECINSVLEQTYTNWELLLVDDGSTDASPQICDEFAAKDSRIRVFHQENQGVSATRNLAMCNGNGVYFAFADSDDILEQDYLAYLYELLLQGGEISCCRMMEFTNELTLEIEEKETTTFFSCLQAVQAILYNTGSWMINSGPSCKMFLSKFVQRFYFPNEYTYAEDLIFNMYVFREASRVVAGSKVKYHRRMRADSACGTCFTDESIEKTLQIPELVKGVLGYTGEMAKAIDYCEIDLCFKILHNLAKNRGSSEYEWVIRKRILEKAWPVIFNPRVRVKAKGKILLYAIWPKAYFWLRRKEWG